MTGATSRQLPARRAEKLEDVAGAVARVISAGWGDLARMDRAAATEVAEVILTSYPDWGAAEVLEFATVLGGRVYWTARFWEDVANSVEAFDGYVTRRVLPDDPDWPRLMGETDPAAIAAVVVTEVHRQDRKYPTTDFNYVVVSDPILYDYKTVALDKVRGRPQAEAAAESAAANAGADRYSAFYRRGQGAGWFVRLGFRKPDADALAMKKCLTTSPRRALMKSFSRQQAKALVVAARVEDRLQTLTEERTARALTAGIEQLHPYDAAHELFFRLVERGYPFDRARDTIAARYGEHLAREVVVPLLEQAHGKGGVRTADDPYTDEHEVDQANGVRRRERNPVTTAEEPALAQLEPGQPEASEPRAPIDDKPIDERRRRHLLGMLRDRDFTDLAENELAALKAIVAQLRGEPVAKVSSKAIRWAELEEIVEEIEALPERPPAEGPPEEWDEGDGLPF